MIILCEFDNSIIKLYHSSNEYLNDTFCPDSIITKIITYESYPLIDETYSVRKQYAREAAQFFQAAFTAGTVFSYDDIAKITNILEKWARKYGLIREFRENGII